MDQHTMVEQAYKNGYAKGLEDGKKAAVVHGRWVDNGIPESVLRGCSVCGFTCGAPTFNYCPNCGAMMSKEAENE